MCVCDVIGQVTFRVKKPLKGITVTIAFYGVTEVEGKFVNFISAFRDLYSGDLIQEGLRSFLFAFRFPHVNLPPTSDRPLISYSFSAKLAVDDRPDSRETLPFSHTTEIMEYRTKPLRIAFIPYVDPSLETPLISRKPSMRKKKSSDKTSFKKPDNRSAYTLYPPGSPGSPTTSSSTPRVRGPKLTLTTADIPLYASSNSTPVIDKPHPSTLSSAIERTTRITDEDNNTIAKLTIEMPSSRFLPGDNIVMKFTLQIRNGLPLPKGFGARVVETRALAGESPDGEAIERQQDDGTEVENQPMKMKVVGKEHLRVLTGKKFILHHSETVPIKPEEKKDGSSPPINQDTGLAGGLELVKMITVALPPFQTFITDSLLPTTTLPLGDPRNDNDIPESPTPTSPNPKIIINGSTSNSRSKGKSIDNTSAIIAKSRSLYFRVTHLVQITIPMSSGSHWYSAASRSALGDLEVTVPIILGNKNPKFSRPPEVRLVGPELGGGGSSSGRRWSQTGGEGSSSHSSRSNSGVGSVEITGASTGTTTTGTWRKGMKFLTLREAPTRPEFVVDS
ncbi:hypothetical protein K440DRAFT_399058 [Wilcoxina mikolae CBS 423.85]|nr:hypothetical protein K440DRAFT_399058 [Wilcoxina mikolae CBS 423.85]